MYTKRGEGGVDPGSVRFLRKDMALVTDELERLGGFVRIGTPSPAPDSPWAIKDFLQMPRQPLAMGA